MSKLWAYFDFYGLNASTHQVVILILWRDQVTASLKSKGTYSLGSMNLFSLIHSELNSCEIMRDLVCTADVWPCEGTKVQARRSPDQQTHWWYLPLTMKWNTVQTPANTSCLSTNCSHQITVGIKHQKHHRLQSISVIHLLLCYCTFVTLTRWHYCIEWKNL